MEKHPIKVFIDDLFSNKPEEKRNAWATFLINQEYDSIQDLRQISEKTWESFRSSIPKKIEDEIRGKLNQNMSTDITLLQKTQMCALLDSKQFSPEKIVELLGAKLGTPKGDVLLQQIKFLIKPPKPFPKDHQQITAKLTEKGLPLYHYQGKCLAGVKYYTLLVIGETGTGKTTLLDAFVNKLTGMEFTDNWRWKLVNEDKLKHVTTEKSQTLDINEYYINDHQNKFNIKIIDSPGLGDTKGIKSDDETIQKFQDYFKTTSEIDYILLTIKSSETKMKPSSKYIYSRIQQVFGADARDRFLLMCTFSDGVTPNCVSTIKNENISYEKYFTFNNAHLYTPSDKANTSSKFYWNMAMDSVESFSDFIIKADRIPMSLTQSKTVLATRKYLEQSIKTSQKSFIDTFNKFDLARLNLKELKQNRKQIQENGQYTRTETETISTPIALGNTYQMCYACQTICCQICVWPSNATESQCSYFRDGKNCPCCPGKCSKSRHIRTDVRIQKKVVEHKRTIDCKKLAYETGLSGAKRFDNEFMTTIQNLDRLSNEIWRVQNEIKANLASLNSIALQPKFFEDKDFYNQMIQQEQEKRETGFTERVKYLKDALGRIEFCQSITAATSIDTLFPELKTLKSQYQAEKQRKALY